MKYFTTTTMSSSCMQLLPHKNNSNLIIVYTSNVTQFVMALFFPPPVHTGYTFMGQHNVQ
jgi:hypothetical protein